MFALFCFTPQSYKKAGQPRHKSIENVEKNRNPPDFGAKSPIKGKNRYCNGEAASGKIFNKEPASSLQPLMHTIQKDSPLF